MEFLLICKKLLTLNHDILLSKIEHYGVRGSSQTWFKSYLHDGKQFVSVNGHSSSICKISCGIPQGSMLGPLLFLIYINDLQNSSKLLNIFLFADDHTGLITKVNKELKIVKVRMDCNKLALNSEKTNFVLFHSPRKKTNDLIPLKFDKESIKRATYLKFLGVLVDEHLSRKCHICELRKKLSRTTGLIFKLRRWLPLATLICLYNSLFSSFLNYGIIVYGLSLTHILILYFFYKRKSLDL